ncbi:MAG: hypothetical protein JWO09_883 [Bacteroidetes bacterium]|nr:hypothetical protein [Bacteroidota bacterium]
MSNKVARTIEEIIKIGRLQKYSQEVSLIINKIHDQGCFLSPHYISQQSWFSYEDSVPRIRLSLVNKEPLHVIWDILHEFGHFLSGKTEIQGPDYKREILAWEWAQKELILYPSLQSLMKDFEEYREGCLESYKKYM